MSRDGVLAQHQRRSDLSIRETSRDQAEDLDLTVRERGPAVSLLELRSRVASQIILRLGQGTQEARTFLGAAAAERVHGGNTGALVGRAILGVRMMRSSPTPLLAKSESPVAVSSGRTTTTPPTAETMLSPVR